MYQGVGVVGGGLMGSGIAEAAALAGFTVTVIETADGLDGAVQRIRRSLDKSRERGQLSDEHAREVVERINVSADFEALADVDLVIEAVPEEIEIKRHVLSRVESFVNEAVVYASNTSSFPIADIAAGARRPEQVVGLHFFNPVKAMKLVEVVPGVLTSSETMTRAAEFARHLDKEVIVASDRAGFIVNALLFPYILGAIRMLDAGRATAPDIDKAMRLGSGVPMGPLELADFVGLDTTLSIAEALYEEYREPQYIPPPVLARLVISGRLGRKSGRGFYDYLRD